MGGALVDFMFDTGLLSSYDIVAKTGTTIPKDTSLYCNFVLPVNSTHMLDSAVSEFHFKRIA